MSASHRHKWNEITQLRDRERIFRCASCQARATLPADSDGTPPECEDDELAPAPCAHTWNETSNLRLVGRSQLETPIPLDYCRRCGLLRLRLEVLEDLKSYEAERKRATVASVMPGPDAETSGR